MGWPILIFAALPILLFLCLLGAAVVNYVRSGDVRASRRRLAGKGVPIDQLQENQASKALGVVRCLGEPLRAPLSNRECTFYQVRIERRVERLGEGPSSYAWEGQDCETASVDFLLVDHTGLARVDVRRAQFHATADHFVRAGSSPEADEQFDRFADKHGLGGWRVFLGEGPVRLTEAVFEPRETVVVHGLVGAAEPHHDPKLAGLRELPMRAVLYGSETQPLAISDDFNLTQTVLTGL